jgi:hypothetical protein
MPAEVRARGDTIRFIQVFAIRRKLRCIVKQAESATRKTRNGKASYFRSFSFSRRKSLSSETEMASPIIT